MLGVIGPNGAGKSTLLTLLSGIVEATTGTVALHGRLGALLDLGGGFVHDLTGRENAILAGVVAGLTKQEIEERLDEIVAFAEVENFLDQPVRTYSTGMRMRLAFSVSVHTEPEILLVDEYLSVGDLSFQSRCRTRIADLRAAGCAMVVVSHGLNDLKSTCDRALWLDDGKVAALDMPDEVIARYEAAMHERTLELTPATLRTSDSEPSANQAQQRLGSREVEIARVALTPSATVRSGGPLVVEIGYVMRHVVSSPIFGVSITREDGLLCVDTNTEGARVQTSNLASAGTITFSIPRLELTGGRYFLNVGIYETNWKYAYDFHWRAYPFFVDGTLEHKGVLAPGCQWSFTRNSPSQPKSLFSDVTAAN
jgi:lipopolysaccharide transport system ATP-binding protein